MLLFPIHSAPKRSPTYCKPIESTLEKLTEHLCIFLALVHLGLSLAVIDINPRLIKPGLVLLRLLHRHRHSSIASEMVDFQRAQYD